jgi:hypothetical protein
MEIHINFLRECARYFENKVVGTKEDREHWAYRQNAENLRKAADALVAAHQHIQLHAGDCLSLDNEVNLMRSHWEEEMAENAALKAEVAEARAKADIARGEADFLRREYANIPNSHALEKLASQGEQER